MAHDDHTHSHSPGELLNLPRRAAAPEPPAPDPIPEDAGARALSEALRSSFGVVKVLMIVLVLIFLGSGIFVVEPGEKAVILRLGRPVGAGESVLKGEGIHWAWPYPIDEVEIIPLAQSQTLVSRTGWHQLNRVAEAAGNEAPPAETIHPGASGYTLTADTNIIHVLAELRYQVSDPIQYLFEFRNPTDHLGNILDNALFFASSRYRVDDAVSRDLSGFRETIEARVRQLAQEQKLGITVERVDLRASVPPRRLTNEFQAVLRAEQERRQKLDAARQEATALRNDAAAEAAVTVAKARAEAGALLGGLEAEARRFRDLLPQYRANPELVKQRLASESVGKALQEARDVWVFSPVANGRKREIRVQLNPEPPALEIPKPAPRKENH